MSAKQTAQWVGACCVELEVFSSRQDGNSESWCQEHIGRKLMSSMTLLLPALRVCKNKILTERFGIAKGKSKSKFDDVGPYRNIVSPYRWDAVEKREGRLPLLMHETPASVDRKKSSYG